MTKLMEAMGERLLRRVLGTAEAGACVPEYGTQCNCSRDAFDYFCDRERGYKKTYYKKRYTFNCTGSCTTKTSVICGTDKSSNPC